MEAPEVGTAPSAVKSPSRQVSFSGGPPLSPITSDSGHSADGGSPKVSSPWDFAPSSPSYSEGVQHSVSAGVPPPPVGLPPTGRALPSAEKVLSPPPILLRCIPLRIFPSAIVYPPSLPHAMVT